VRLGAAPTTRSNSRATPRARERTRCAGRGIPPRKRPPLPRGKVDGADQTAGRIPGRPKPPGTAPQVARPGPAHENKPDGAGSGSSGSIRSRTAHRTIEPGTAIARHRRSENRLRGPGVRRATAPPRSRQGRDLLHSPESPNAPGTARSSPPRSRRQAPEFRDATTVAQRRAVARGQAWAKTMGASDSGSRRTCAAIRPSWTRGVRVGGRTLRYRGGCLPPYGHFPIILGPATRDLPTARVPECDTNLFGLSNGFGSSLPTDGRVACLTRWSSRVLP
jgi:hypothetical protein